MPTEYEQFVNQYKVGEVGMSKYDQFINEYKIDATPTQRKTRQRTISGKDPFAQEGEQGQPDSDKSDYDQFIAKYSKPKKSGGLRPKPVMEEKSFIAKHPNLYGAFGVAQELIPFIQYVDPTERERFAKLSGGKKTKELLLQGFEVALAVALPAVGKAVTPTIAKLLPKTYKAFKFIKTPIKEMGELARTPATEVARKGIAEMVAKAAPKPISAIAKATPEATQHPAVAKMSAAIKEAKSLRKVQETIYTQERSKRLAKATAAGKKVSGEAGFYAQKKQLKGKMFRVEFESIRKRIGQKDIDALFKIVHDSPVVRGFQNITAKEGLANLLGVKGGKLPTEGQLALLEKIFPKDFIRALAKKRPLWDQAKEAGLQIANIPRSIMASFDLSAPFRQGLLLGMHSPKRFGQSFLKMFRQFGSEKAYRVVQESIAQKPTYELMQKANLALTDIGKYMTLREEAFMSQWAEKIPLIGRGVRASGRAHTGFLNKLRADVFEDLVLKAKKVGRDPYKDMDLTKQIAKFVNAASGRGSLGGLERSAVSLNATLFSPRLIAARLTFFNPAYYIKADPFVRKEAIRSMLTLASVATTVLSLAKAGGAEVGTDWRSANFAKIKIGNTRIDILGGFQQYIRAAGQIRTGEYVSSITGKVTTLGEGYKPTTRWDILQRQAEQKLAPAASFVMALMKGQDIMGEDISVPKEVLNRATPMVIQDIVDIAKEDPDLLPLGALGMFGVGLQTYGPRPNKSRKGYRGY
jgi:hypothetical protein